MNFTDEEPTVVCAYAPIGREAERQRERPSAVIELTPTGEHGWDGETQPMAVMR